MQLNATSLMLNATGKAGQTALIFASQGGHTRAIEVLLARGTEVKHRPCGEFYNPFPNPLSYSNPPDRNPNSEVNATEVMLNATTNDGMTSLMYAANGGYTAVIALLITKGAEVKAAKLSP